MTKQMTVDKHLRRHLKARAKAGKSKYGVPLLPFNGRNPRKDKREELLDALVYNEQDILEREQLARDLEGIHSTLYNFRQPGEFENQSLDQVIALLGVIVAQLEADTERIEPKKLWPDEPGRDEQFAADLSKALRFEMVLPKMTEEKWTTAPPMSREELRIATFGPDTPPVESQRWFSEYHERPSVPLGPVLESIRKDGPIGHRDLLDIAAQHRAMERLEKMECNCCGKCVQ